MRLEKSVARGVGAQNFPQNGGSACRQGDCENTLREFETLAVQGNVDAQFKLGLMYARAPGMPQNYHQALKWFRIAAEQGHASASLWLRLGQEHLADGVRAYYGGDYETALSKFKPLAEQGNAMAQCLLGAMQHNGEGVPPNFQKGLRWLRLAAEQGSAEAQTHLGVIYYNGEGVPQSYREAFRWLRLAAEQGSDEAQSHLGVIYYCGEGVPQSYPDALRWLRLAAERDVGEAQLVLGVMYYRGDGMPQDFVQSHKWLNLAAAQDYDDAAHLRQLIAEQMYPGQIAEAQRLARRWKPKSASISQLSPEQRLYKSLAKAGWTRTLVLTVQKKLRKLGYDAGPVDGQYERRMEAAIREFQRDRDMTVTGSLSTDLIDALDFADGKDQFYGFLLSKPIRSPFFPKSSIKN
ncbi:MAG: SEL1-like repeat protein [Gammaproteobacteria bacterium]|nr:SEL1-like repeat protein [Gammaproteobacteria bacterium]